MRLHTDSTLALLDNSTTILGRAFRHFVAETCPAFATKETKAEYEARKRAQARAATASGPLALPDGRRPRVFNMRVVKLHFLGDYVTFIRLKGSTDSWTTQTVRLSHFFLSK